MRQNQRRHWFLRLLTQPSGAIGLSLVLVLVFVAVTVPWLSWHDPNVQDYTRKFSPPFWQDGNHPDYWLGTDVLGRDVLTRILYGSRLSLFIGGLAVLVGGLIGIPLGMLSGFLGGRFDLLMMRLVDLMLAFPSLLLAVVIVAILGPDLTNCVIAIGLVNIPTYARIARSSVLAEAQKEYVAAAKVMGQSFWAILFRGVTPNILGPLTVVISLSLGTAILDAAGLSFLGLGAQPPTPEWGALILEGKNYIFQAPWLIIFPGIAILLTVVAFNLLGDALREVFDVGSN